MSIKGVHAQQSFWEKRDQGKTKSSSGDFGDTLSAASDQSGKEAGKDSAQGKEIIPENKLLSTDEIMQMISSRKSEILEKVKKGETEPVIQIGAQAFTEKQWKRMLESLDDSEKDFKEKIKEALEQLREQRKKLAEGDQSCK